MGRARHERKRNTRGVVTVWFCALILAGSIATSGAVEPLGATATVNRQPQRSQSQERFLQHFISDSLGQSERNPSSTTTSQGAPLAYAPKHAAPEGGVPDTLSAAATKMVVSLGAILGLLLGGWYVVRRFLLKHTAFGNRESLIRILTKVNVSPKIGIALLQVPGKVLVVGITGSAVTALGEVDPDLLASEENNSVATPLSFPNAREQDRSSPQQDGGDDDALRRASAAIQQKVRRLKRL